MSSILRRNGQIVETQEKGETIKEFEQIDRGKISEESRETQKQAINNGNTEKRLENLEKIVFGKEIHNGSA